MAAPVSSVYDDVEPGPADAKIRTLELEALDDAEDLLHVAAAVEEACANVVLDDV